MKKFLLAFFCCAASVAAFADDYSTTTVLNNAVGVFDNMIVTGESVLNTAEIGARRDKNGPIKQEQNLTVYGTTGLLSASGSTGTKITIGGNLVLKGTDAVDYAFTNVYIYPGKSLFLGGNLAINDVSAKEIRTLNTFSENATGTINVGSGNTFKTGSLNFYSGGNYKIFPSPRACSSSSPCGTIINWTKVDGTAGDNYGEWGPLFQSEQGDTCDGNALAEYTCPDNLEHSGSDFCTDVRRSMVPTQYWSTVGGVYISEARGRRECTYIPSTDKCQMASVYTYSGAVDPIPSNVCPFSVAELDAKFNSNGGTNYTVGQLCYEMCKNPSDPATSGACTSTNQCSVTADNINPIKSGDGSGADLESGIASCTRTQWPAGSGLECTNAWDEKTIRIVTCGAGSGKVYNSGTYYQSRSVTCGKPGTGVVPTSPGTFLTVDFEH